MLFIVSVQEILDLRSVYMRWTDNIELVFRVMAMLNLHFGEAAHVYIRMDVTLHL